MTETFPYFEANGTVELVHHTHGVIGRKTGLFSIHYGRLEAGNISELLFYRKLRRLQLTVIPLEDAYSAPFRLTIRITFMDPESTEVWIDLP